MKNTEKIEMYNNTWRNNWDYNMLQGLYPLSPNLDNVINKAKIENKDLIIFDVGCNAGSFINFVLSKNLDVKNLYAFEPNSHLVNDFLINHYKSYENIKIIESCLGKLEDVLEFHIPGRSPALGSLIDRQVFYREDIQGEMVTVKVNVKTIDLFCQENGIDKIDYIKIDTEGFEFNVLKGANRMLSEGKIMGGQFEWGIEEGDNSLPEMIIYLNNHGYVIEDSEGSIMTPDKTPIDGGDLIFYKK
jgi:FkbM family methyltransferase